MGCLQRRIYSMIIRLERCKSKKLATKDEGTLAMRAFVLCASNLGNTTVGCNDKNGSHIRFQSSVEEREAFHIEHVNFVNEENTGDDSANQC